MFVHAGLHLSRSARPLSDLGVFGGENALQVLDALHLLPCALLKASRHFAYLVFVQLLESVNLDLHRPPLPCPEKTGGGATHPNLRFQISVLAHQLITLVLKGGNDIYHIHTVAVQTAGGIDACQAFVPFLPRSNASAALCLLRFDAPFLSLFVSPYRTVVY